MLEVLLKQGMKKAQEKLRKEMFFSSAEVSVGKSSQLKEYFSGLTKGLGRGYMIEDNLSSIVFPTPKGDIAQSVIMYETAKDVVKNIGSLSTVNLNGQRKEVFAKDGMVMNNLISQFVEEYNELHYKGFVQNNNRLINLTVEYFYGLSQKLLDEIPSYSIRHKKESREEEIIVKGSKEKSFEKEHIKKSAITFQDIVGLEKQKDAFVKSCINPLIKKRELTQKINGKNVVHEYMNYIFFSPEGGTGKTTFAKACAGELGIPFYEFTGPEFEQEFHGRGKNMLTQSYEEAASNPNGAVVFIDEADTICQPEGTKGLELNSSITTQYKSILDGALTKGSVVTIHATNKLDKYDNVLLSRFPENNRLYFGPMSDEMKQAIFVHHLDRFSHEDFSQEDLDTIVTKLGSKSLRNLSQFSIECRNQAVYNNHESITKKDVFDALSYREFLQGEE